jgi:predicted ABC-type exoprotein transport system permease subunit
VKCELKYVAHSYKDVLTNVKYILVIVAGVCIGIYFNIPTYAVNILAVVPFIILYIYGYVHCKKNHELNKSEIK